MDAGLVQSPQPIIRHGLSRPYTSFLLRCSKDVDARHKAGHDEGEDGDDNGDGQLRYAFSSATMSSFFICMNEFMTRLGFAGSGSLYMRGMHAGTTCQERPNLSFSQPQGPSCPPSAVSLSQ